MYLWLSVCACVLVPVGGAPPARSPHASCARSGRSRSPARPCRRPPAPWQFPPVSSTPVEPGVLMIGSACLLEARPGPAAAHRHRGQAPQASRRPPIGRGVCVMSGQAPQASRRPRSFGLVVCVLTGSAAAHLRRGQVLQSLRRPPHRRGLVCWCVVRRSVISHAIRRPHCAGLYQFVMLRHLCL